MQYQTESSIFREHTKQKLYALQRRNELIEVGNLDIK